MKTKNKPSLTRRAVKVAGVKAKLSPVTLGLDLGDKTHSCCVLDASGKVLKKEYPSPMTGTRSCFTRIARVDEVLLHPVEHGGEKQPRDMLAVKLRAGSGAGGGADQSGAL